jgi:paraquat-inducible protein B
MDQEEKAKEITVQLEDIEVQLDESLHKLLKMADSKEESETTVYPSLKQVISQTESEMTKVLDNIESMLASTDEAFTGIKRFKQELAMHDMEEGLNNEMRELEMATERLQNDIFEAIQQLQYQDIIRQKLEKVLNHISSVGEVLSAGLR